MGVIDVRRFDVATHFGRSGELEVAHISDPKEDQWDVNLAQVVEVNALAVPADRKLTYDVSQLELRLLLSFLVEGPASPLTLRRDDFEASSAHVKRFISESFGLGMLTTAAERHYRWNLSGEGLHNFDVLPAAMADQYPRSGIRPDLLFDFTSQSHKRHLAGEARGRSSARPKGTSKSERSRLADIVAWSGVNDLHPVTMTYAYTGAANAQVDLFDIAAPDVRAPGSEIVLYADEESLVTPTGRRFEESSYLHQRALGRAGEIADQLYATAPRSGPGPERTVYGRNVRGSWAAADLIAPSQLRFFLGLLDEPLTPEQAAAARLRRSAAAQDDDPFQIATTGRIFAVVARQTAQEPEWSAVTDRIE